MAITAILLHKFDARVVALSRSQTPELLKLASDDLLILACDVFVLVSCFVAHLIGCLLTSADEPALASALARAEQVYHHIDALVLNAGILDPMGYIGARSSVSDWKRHFDVNFFSLVSALKATLPALRGSELGARVIFVSSGASVKGLPTWGPYSAGKAAVNSLCRYLTVGPEKLDSNNLARTLAEEEPGIVAVAVRPGMVDTDVSYLVITLLIAS